MDRELGDANGIITIDCHDVAARFSAAYLIVDGGEAALIETNTSNAVPYLLAALTTAGGTPEMVKYIIVTHAHLDHAGGAGALVAACPNAVVVAPPGVAAHLMHPLMLIMSTRGVFGAETFERRFSGTQAVAANRILTVMDGEAIYVGSRTLRFIATPGHTTHHYCVWEQDRELIFTGDSFGAAFSFLGKSGKPLLFPLTPPTDFDLAAMLDSFNKIAAAGASCAYLTHFGRWHEIADGRAHLERDLLACSAIAERAQDRAGDEKAFLAECYQEFRHHYCRLLQQENKNLVADEWQVLDGEIRVNARGFAQMMQRRTRRRSETTTAVPGCAASHVLGAGNSNAAWTQCEQTKGPLRDARRP
jgi:glyoxylase-like metal-dependent hydrolase (beta-lactamase superfamily II)